MRRSPIKRSGRLKPMSSKRSADLKRRQDVIKQVQQRAGFQCEYQHVIPEVACDLRPGRNMEVDELRGGSYRSVEWLDPEWCRYTCPAHHDWKTANKRIVLKRLGISGYT
jgi:hypothetical protein